MNRPTRVAQEYGDFQTPPGLAREVCQALSREDLRPAALVEPTCGVGRFLAAGLEAFPSLQHVLAADINPNYVALARAAVPNSPAQPAVELVAADFFATDWGARFAKLPEPILVLGNLPWVTNASLGTLGSSNLPTKSNFQKLPGLAARTGKANFDISEWMLIHLLTTLQGRHATIALLCKSSVARRVLLHCWRSGLPVGEARLYEIDAVRDFGAAVAAVLLVVQVGSDESSSEALIFPSLRAEVAASRFGIRDGQLVADIEAFHRSRHLFGTERRQWRSGIKHDCASVFVLQREANAFRNGLGEIVELEETFLFPLVKASDLASGCIGEDRRWLLVTQRTVGSDPAEIARTAPRTWSYLNAHADRLSRRGSSIYRKRPPFSMFGIGEYSFSPWKVGISGLHKRLRFTVVGPAAGQPRVLDDTSYFLPCTDREEAEELTGLLNSPEAAEFFQALVFWDAKRPITAELLQRLDLERLARSVQRKDD